MEPMTWDKCHNNTAAFSDTAAGLGLKVVPSWTLKFDLALSKNFIIQDLRLSQRFY